MPARDLYGIRVAKSKFALPGSKAAALPFLMYPQAELRGERIDSYDPETFKYTITVREVAA